MSGRDKDSRMCTCLYVYVCKKGDGVLGGGEGRCGVIRGIQLSSSAVVTHTGTNAVCPISLLGEYLFLK